MSDFIAVKRFKVHRSSTRDRRWCVYVYDSLGHEVDWFVASTMKEAESEFEQAGYSNAFSLLENSPGGDLIIVIPLGGLS